MPPPDKLFELDDDGDGDGDGDGLLPVALPFDPTRGSKKDFYEISLIQIQLKKQRLLADLAAMEAARAAGKEQGITGDSKKDIERELASVDRSIKVYTDGYYAAEAAEKKAAASGAGASAASL